jgi:hypothetical protein
MSDETQTKLADSFYKEIDTYLENFRSIDVGKREKLASTMNIYMMSSAIVPIIITFISAYAYVLTQSIAIFLASLLDVVPPILQNQTKGEIDFYNKCSNLKNNFVALKGNISRLAIIGALKDEALATVREEIDKLKDAMSELLRI